MSVTRCPQLQVLCVPLYVVSSQYRELSYIALEMLESLYLDECVCSHVTNMLLNGSTHKSHVRFDCTMGTAWYFPFPIELQGSFTV